MTKENDMSRNAEHYADPTSGTALRNIAYQEEAARLKDIKELVPVLKRVAECYGFEIIDRIALKHKATGKEYR